MNPFFDVETDADLDRSFSSDFLNQSSVAHIDSAPRLDPGEYRRPHSAAQVRTSSPAQTSFRSSPAQTSSRSSPAQTSFRSSPAQTYFGEAKTAVSSSSAVASASGSAVAARSTSGSASAVASRSASSRNPIHEPNFVKPTVAPHSCGGGGAGSGAGGGGGGGGGGKGGGGAGWPSFYRADPLRQSTPFLPHPLNQPYQRFPSRLFSTSNRQSGVQNFFQSPFAPSSSAAAAAAAAADANESFLRTPSLEVIINNVVSVCSVRCHLDLHAICQQTVNVVFKRDRNVLIMKLRTPRVTCRLWSSGKISCTGAPSEEDAKRGCRRVARTLSKLGYKVRFSSYRIVNILATCVFPFAVKLVKFVESAKNVTYEPELHPGAVLKFDDLKGNLRVFSTGSVTVTAPTVSAIHESVTRAYQMVYEFRNEEREKLAEAPGNRFKNAMSIVPLLSQLGSHRNRVIPKGPYHSKYKQTLHREILLSAAIQQVRTAEQTDDFLLDSVYDSDSDFSD